MAFSFHYLTEDNLFEKFTASKKHTEALTEPFPEFERIARNRPYEAINSKYPKVTDGTTSSIIRKTSRRVLQQVPTGSVVADTDDDWLPIVAGFLYQNEILPNANEDYDLIQKGWTVIEKGLALGSAASYAPFISHDGLLTPDMTVSFWGDLYIQPGKKSGYACKYLFLRSWFQKEDIEALIEQEKDLKAQAKERGEKYEAAWDTAALKEILDRSDAKAVKQKEAYEKERNITDSGIELVTGFQVGVGATFYTFHPASKTIVRRKKSKDPRGKMPIDFFYAETDGANPLGRGIVEIIGGLQNMIDADMQMFHWNRALMIDPPMKKKGQFNSNTVAFEPGRINDLGTDPNADLVVMSVDTTSIQTYPQIYQLQQSQLFNLVQSPQSTLSTSDAALGQGKTPAALNQQKATISVDDNYIRKMFEAWFQNWSETAINLYFAERTGIELIQLDDETANKLRNLAKENKFDITQLSDDNKIMINFDDATPALKFRVDASTSKLQDDQTQQAAFSSLIQAIDASPVLAQMMSQKYPDKILALWNKIVTVSGVEDPEDLAIDLDEFKAQLQQDQQMQAQQAQMQAQVPQQQPQMPQQGDVGGQTQPQGMEPTDQENAMETQGDTMPEMSVNDQFTQMLQQLGFDDQVILQAHQMADNGSSDAEIMQALGIQSGR